MKTKQLAKTEICDEIETNQRNAFDLQCDKAEAKLRIVQWYRRSGVRYEAIGFSGDNLMSIKAKFPLEPGERVAPKPITIRASVEWAGDMGSVKDWELPDSGGNCKAAAQWYRLIAKHLEAHEVP